MKKFWTAEKILGLSALFVSLCTLFVFIYQTNLIRKQQYMSVYPHLNLTNYHSESLNYKYVLINQGVGPAFIKSIHVKELNGKPYDSLLDYIEDKLEERDSIWFHYSDLYEGQLIPANKEIILFGLSDRGYTKAQNLPLNTIAGAKKLRQILNSDSLEIKITYESIYSESWSITSDSEMPVKN